MPPGKWHACSYTRCCSHTSTVVSAAKRLRPSTTRATLLLTFMVALILPLEAKAPLFRGFARGALNEGNYEEEVGDDDGDDKSAIKNLARARLNEHPTHGPALVPVADIPAVWTCNLEFVSGDAEKWKQWKKSPIYRGHQRLELSTRLKGTAENPGQWAAQRAYVVELVNGSFYQSKYGEAFAMNETFQVQNENLLNTVCSVCPERYVQKRQRWSALKKPNTKQVFWTKPTSQMASITNPVNKKKSDGALQVKALLVFPSAMSYWASRRYQHGLMDLLPHLVPYISFLKAHREVQVAVPSQFHFFLLTLGLQPQQLLNTAANLFRAEKLYVGLFLDEHGTINSAQCASCCASCWRNPGLIANFNAAVKTFVDVIQTSSNLGLEEENGRAGKKQTGAAVTNSLKCRAREQFQFRRCYRTQQHDATPEEVRQKLLLVGGMLKTFAECSALAVEEDAKYFAMERPELEDKRVDETAECWLSRATKHIGVLDRRMQLADSTEECHVEGGDSCGRHLGGKSRMALYAVDKEFRASEHVMSSRPAVVYAARPDCYLPKCRTVVNHADVVDRITSTVKRMRPGMDVVVFNPEKDPTQKSFEYQVQLFHRAKVLIGAHGGALTNLMFMQPGCHKSSVIEFVGDKVSDVYAETHKKLLTPPYKSLHYAYYGSMVNYSLAVYDKVISTSPRTPNRTSIPLDDLEVALAKKLV